MADEKKISGLTNKTTISADDEFVFVDKDGTGADASASGQTSKIKFSDLQTAVGTQGPAGETGVAGPVGPVGPAGPAGADGHGIEGPKGDKGDKGDPGAQGVNGVKGDAGAPGVKGDKGDAGAPGVKGDKGDQGNSITGPAGPAGPTGPKGNTGNTGPAGPQGSIGNSSTSRHTFKDSVNFGDHQTGDSEILFKNNDFNGDETHVGRIRVAPQFGQASFRVRGYLDFKMSDASDACKPILEVGSGYTSNSMVNPVDQENRCTLSVKGNLTTVASATINTAGNQPLYLASGLVQSLTNNDDLTLAAGNGGKVKLAFTDGMYSFLQPSILECSHTEILCHRNTRYMPGYGGVSTGVDESEVEGVENTSLKGIETINKIKVSDYKTGGNLTSGMVAQDLQVAMPEAVSEYTDTITEVVALGNAVVAADSDQEEQTIISENITLEDFCKEKENLPETCEFVETQEAQTKDVAKLGIRHDKLITALVKAVQELSEQVVDLQNQLNNNE